jgi:CHASE3 domain sensor protein
MPVRADDPTAREVLIELHAHVQSCEKFQRLNFGFIAAVLSVVVVFAGYTYVQNQELERHQMESAQASIAAVGQAASQASDQTARKLGAVP